MIHEEGDLIPYSPSPLPRGPYLIFSPHPDDAIIGMGGTMTLAAEAGIEMGVVAVTDGGRGGDPSVREREEIAAQKVVGVAPEQVHFLGLKDRELYREPFPKEEILALFHRYRPATVFSPTFLDLHPDHRSLTLRLAAFLSHEFPHVEMWLYDGLKQGEINRLINIDPVMDVKLRAIALYESQIAQVRYDLVARSMNTLRAVTLQDVRFAEGFWSSPVSELLSGLVVQLAHYDVRFF